METATIEAGISGDAWNATAAKYHAIDGAVRRKIARQQDGSDELLLDQHGITGPRLQDEQTRLSGVAYRKQRAGDPDKLATAVTAHEQAEESLATQQKSLGPKIEQIRKQLVTLEGQLNELRAKEQAAAKVVTDMRSNRKLLEGLLPQGLKEAIVAMERPIRSKWQPKLAEARQAVSMATHLSASDEKVGAIQSAESRQKSIEQQMEAELATVARELKDFYFDA